MTETPLTSAATSAYDDGKSQNGLGQVPAINPLQEQPETAPEWVADPSRAYAEIQRLRQEAAEYRKLKAKQEEAERKAREEQGQFKALYEELQAKHGDAQKKLEAYERQTREVLENRLASVPEGIRELLSGQEPAQALAWLEAHAQDFLPKRAPQTDAGVTGDRVESMALNADELRIARMMGISPERYAEQKKRLLK